jgi:O-antigen/teichoic acid export membrane protein
MITTRKIHYYNHQQYKKMSGILMISAWGFALVIASFLFLWLGYKLDQYLGTAPNFMFGLFFLAIFICVMRLYQEAKLRMKEL